MHGFDLIKFLSNFKNLLDHSNGNYFVSSVVMHAGFPRFLEVFKFPNFARLSFWVNKGHEQGALIRGMHKANNRFTKVGFGCGVVECDSQVGLGPKP